MTFLSPGAALIAAAIAIPLIVMLYMLRLRRRSFRISSTLLWPSESSDLVANAPWRRPRFSPLMLLQLLIAALLILALARPAAEAPDLGAGRTILLIDRSASMQAPIGPSAEDGTVTTRFDWALDEARRLANQVNDAAPGAGEVLVIGFGARPSILSAFESDGSRLEEALEGLTPTDEEADLAAALAIAAAFGRQGDDDTGPPPEVILLSDGGVRPPHDGAFDVQAGAFRHLAPPADNAALNIGIVSFSAERRFDDPSRVDLFLRLASAFDEPRETTVVIRRDFEPLRSERLTLPAAEPTGPGEATMTTTIEAPGACVLVASISGADGLAADDVAALVVPAPRQLRLALIAPDAAPDEFLQKIVEATEPGSLVIAGPERLDELASGEIDLLILDRVPLTSLPNVPTLSVGATPPGATISPPADTAGHRLLSWERRHPLLRHVPLDGLVFARTPVIEDVGAAETLAAGPHGPVILLLTDRGIRHAFLAFALRQSNLPVLPGFPVLVQNALDFLAAAGAGMSGVSARTGEPVSLEVEPGATAITITRADGTRVAPVTPVAPDARVAVVPGVPEAGLFSLDGATARRLAVNLESAIESDTRIRYPLEVTLVGGDGRRVAPLLLRERWTWLAWAVLLLLAIEWIVYLWRARDGWSR